MKYIIFITIITVITFLVSPTHAQFDVANVFDISDPQIKEGDILIFDSEKGLQKASLPYDSHLFGIFQEQPGIVFRRADDSGKPVVRSGIAKVNVSLSNGEIKKGDSITSSTLPGLGMKASSPGYVVGIALEDSKEDKDQIDVAIDISFKDLTNLPTSSLIDRLLSSFINSLLQSAQNDQGFQQIIKNILAAIIILIAILFGLFIISRIMPKAIEAIGRNPLAKRSIEISLILSIIIVVAVVIASIAAAVIILRL